jgi:hypothetical protein
MSFLFDQGEAAFAKRASRLSVGEVIARAFSRRLHAHAESDSLGLAERRLGLVRMTKPQGTRKPSPSPNLGS